MLHHSRERRDGVIADEGVLWRGRSAERWQTQQRVCAHSEQYCGVGGGGGRRGAFAEECREHITVDADDGGEPQIECIEWADGAVGNDQRLFVGGDQRRAAHQSGHFAKPAIDIQFIAESEQKECDSIVSDQKERFNAQYLHRELVAVYIGFG